MSVIKFFAFLVLFFVKVDGMALKGPVLTRYDPCGLGVIQFDKFAEIYWQGTVHLGLYKHLQAVEIEIQFEKKVKLFGTPKNMVPLDNLGHSFLIRALNYVPMQYKFNMTVLGLEANETDVPTVKTFSLNNVVLCDDRIKESLNFTNEDDQKVEHVCGRRSLDHTELVSLRTEAKAGDWPWHVAILTRKPNSTEDSYYCGGNIISRTAVVTAGHCVRKNRERIPTNTITVVAGVSNYRDLKQPGRQTLPVLDVILHPDYTDAFATSDVAILKVNKFTYTTYVQPICLWGPVYEKDSLVGREATVVGFGHDENNKPSEVLKSTYITVQTDATCLNYSPKVYGDLINEFTICAGYGPSSGVSPRNGDSGGGLVYPVMQHDHKVTYFLRGVLSKCGVSPGHTECDPKFYVVYTDIAPHYGWIYHHAGLPYKNNIIY